nr:hypothetical protein [Tanacetum cinerariifolium]
MISAQIDDLSSYTTKYTSLVLTQKVFANIRRVGKGFSGVDTPLFEGMLVPQPAHDVVANNVATDDVVADADAESTPPSPTPATLPPPRQDVTSTPPSLPHQSLIAQPPSSPPPQQQPSHDNDKIAQAIEITKLKQRVRKLEKKRKLKVSGGSIQSGGKIAEIDADEDVTLEEVAAVTKGAKVAEKDADAHGRQEESQAQVYHIDLEHVDKVLKVFIATPSAARRRKGVVIRDPEETDTPSTIVHSVPPKSKDKGKGIMVKEPKPLKKQAQIEQDEAYARELEAELNKNINWDEVIEQVKRKEKEDNAVLRYQALKRKPQTEAHDRKNMMVYLKNVTGFKMDFFKGMSYNDIRPIFKKHFNSIVGFLEKSKEQLEEAASKALKRKSKSSEQQAAKKQKLDEEVEELKTHLQIIPNDEDDVYTKATPLALKVPVVDYQIHTKNNKPYYKIIRADGTR